MGNLVDIIEDFKIDYAQRLIDNNIPADIASSAKLQLELGFMDVADQLGQSLSILLSNITIEVDKGINLDIPGELTDSVGTGSII